MRWTRARVRNGREQDCRRHPVGCLAASDISRQAKRVNSGVRPTVLYRETETGERRASSIETIGVFVAISIPDRRDQIMARDIAGSFARELIGLLDNFAVGLEK